MASHAGVMFDGMRDARFPSREVGKVEEIGRAIRLRLVCFLVELFHVTWWDQPRHFRRDDCIEPNCCE